MYFLPYIGGVYAAFLMLPSLVAVFAFGELWRRTPLHCLVFVLIAAPVTGLVKTLAWVLAPFLALLSVILGRDTLPFPLSLLHTHDDTLDGGIRQVGWPEYRNVFDKWKGRTAWILRNPAYGFMLTVMGAKHTSKEIHINYPELAPCRFLAGNVPLVRRKFGPFFLKLGWKTWRNPSAPYEKGKYMICIGLK